jgi:hypothetical protein
VCAGCHGDRNYPGFAAETAIMGIVTKKRSAYPDSCNLSTAFNTGTLFWCKQATYMLVFKT